MDEDIDECLQKHFRQIATNAAQLVEPIVIGIYGPRSGDGGGVYQVGTGFLVRPNGRTIMVTAKHTLYGHDFDETPDDKLIIANNALTPLGELSTGEVCKTDNHDLACMIVDELADRAAVSSAQLIGREREPRAVTIYGYLSKGLRINRNERTLRPDPYCITCLHRDQPNGFVGMQFSIRKFRNSCSGAKVKAPRPEGLSGGPMLDSDALSQGEVKVLGLFTTFKQQSGFAFGERADDVKALIGRLIDHHPL